MENKISKEKTSLVSYASLSRYQVAIHPQPLSEDVISRKATSGFCDIRII